MNGINLNKIASSKTIPFKYVYFGDPQNDIKEDVSRIFREAYICMSDASLWSFVCNLNDEPNDSLWTEWFEVSRFIH